MLPSLKKEQKLENCRQLFKKDINIGLMDIWIFGSKPSDNYIIIYDRVFHRNNQLKILGNFMLFVQKVP